MKVILSPAKSINEDVQLSIEKNLNLFSEDNIHEIHRKQKISFEWFNENKMTDNYLKFINNL